MAYRLFFKDFPFNVLPRYDFKELCNSAFAYSGESNPFPGLTYHCLACSHTEEGKESRRVQLHSPDLQLTSSVSPGPGYS
jgi:hypothetical protein